VKDIKVQKKKWMEGRKKGVRDGDKKNHFVERLNLLMDWKVTTSGRVILRFFRGLRQSI
jgi:hypothetical protein